MDSRVLRIDPRPRARAGRAGQARAPCRAPQPAVREALGARQSRRRSASRRRPRWGGSSGRWTRAGRELPPVRRDRQDEVYLQACDAALEREMGAIVLVPEIGLTPQAVGRFRARFGDRIAILHSALGGAERRDERVRISSGEARIVIGARSAVFAPVRGSASSAWTRSTMLRTSRESDPRDARTVAAKRASLEAAAVYGSATPRPESWSGSNDSSSVDAWPGRCRRCVSSISGTRRDIRSRHRCSSSCGRRDGRRQGDPAAEPTRRRAGAPLPRVRPDDPLPELRCLAGPAQGRIPALPSLRLRRGRARDVPLLPLARARPPRRGTQRLERELARSFRSSS